MSIRSQIYLDLDHDLYDFPFLRLHWIWCWSPGIQMSKPALSSAAAGTYPSFLSPQEGQNFVNLHMVEMDSVPLHGSLR